MVNINSLSALRVSYHAVCQLHAMRLKVYIDLQEQKVPVPRDSDLYRQVDNAIEFFRRRGALSYGSLDESFLDDLKEIVKNIL